MVSYANQKSSAPRGISIIILTLDAAPLLDRLMTSFFDVNTYMPVELIIIDHGSGDDTGHVIARHAHKGFIRHINRGQNYSFANSCNHGAASARYPYLLFLNNDIIYTSDALPSALSKLEQESTIGAVGIRLDDDPGALSKETVPGIQHLGIEFKWNEKRGYFQPEQIRRPDSKTASLLPSSRFPAVTGAFLLCRKTDFQALKDFSEDYVYGLEDIDFCLRMGRDLKKTCWCIHDMSLQHVEGATRRLGDKTERAERIEANHRIFKERWGGYIRELLDIQPTGDKADPLPAVSHQAVVRHERNSRPTLRILFVLPQAIDSNCGYHVERLAAGLQAQGTECMAAVPQNANPSSVTRHLSLVTHTYAEIQKNGVSFSNGQGPDIIHAWTPREGVRQFVASLTAKTPCPVVIHLEDNEEYLTETAVGQPFAELEKLAQKELDKIIPNNRYHPIHGRRFLEQAQGLTLIIDTLEKFNFAHVPSLTILPPVDERLFYPRPINYTLRRKLDIPDNHIVLVYTGNVHAGNREEVLTLYQAVQLLNQQGHPTTLIRTGINAVPLTDGDDAWIKNFEIPLGWVSREEIPDIMAAADMFVQPGKPGPFNDYRIPCKLPEYFAMGRPMILPGTNLGCLTVHGQEAYVLNKADGEGIAKAVLEIRGNTEISEKLAANGVNFYLQELCNHLAEDLKTYYYGVAVTAVPDGFVNKKEDPPPVLHEKSCKTTNQLIETDQLVAKTSVLEKKITDLESEKRNLIERIKRMPVIDPFCLRNPETIWENKAGKEFGIIVFGHTRFDHIQALLESLKKQNAIQYVHFWMDGFQGKTDLKEKTDTVFEMVRSYPVASIRRHSGQLGFRKIMIQGLIEMCREFEHIMVLEDDCFPTRDAVEIFRNEIRQIADNDRIFSVYGHHFLTPGEGETCPRFQGWGWGTTRRKLMPILRQLIDCYSMTEERYLEFVKMVLTPEIMAKIDSTPPRYTSHTLTKFFAWDETVCLLSALNNQVHKPTPKRTIYNCGMGKDSAHFIDIDLFRKPAFNLVTLEEVWDFF